MQVGIHERLLCAKFGVLKLLGSWVMSTSSFAYNSLDRGVSRSLTFFRRTSRSRHHSNLIFGTIFHINQELLCAKFGLLKRISSGDTKILSIFNKGLQAWSFTWLYVIPSYLTLTTYSNVQIWHRTASYGCRDVCKIWFEKTKDYESY